MTIKRITVAFVGPGGATVGSSTGSVDRRVDLVRKARAELEEFKSQRRRDGDPEGEEAFTLSITDAPASAVWTPRST